MPDTTRLLIRKDGLGIYLSHLDLMHNMERVFNRAQVRIWHTQGFNPHPYMSFCLPLSLGVASECEIMDFKMEQQIPLEELPARPNKATRVELIVSFSGDDTMTVRVIDKGFGDLFPASDIMIRKDFHI